VVQQGGKVTLDRDLCWVDAWQFEGKLSSAGEHAVVAKVLQLYEGNFLPEDEGEYWSVAFRERLRGKFIHVLATRGQALEALGSSEEAIGLYLRGVDADPVVEAFHQGLMRCYHRLGRRTEAISAYRRMRQTLSAVLSVAPSAEAQALYRTIVDACADLTNDDMKAEEVVIALPLDRRSELLRAGKSRRRRGSEGKPRF
jgi:DNA-binding SARP family transcriptional activator